MARVIKLTEGTLRALIGESMVYQALGLGGYDRGKFEPIRNRIGRNKPYGGLWASPDDENAFTWAKWAEREHFMLDKYKNDDCFRFKLSDGARVLHISKKGDDANIPMQWESISDAFNRVKDENERRRLLRDASWLMMDYKEYKNSGHEQKWLPDFEKLSESYDAIEFKENAFTHWAMYGWDCDCIFVMNPDVIVPV